MTEGGGEAHWRGQDKMGRCARGRTERARDAGVSDGVSAEDGWTRGKRPRTIRLPLFDANVETEWSRIDSPVPYEY